MGKKCRLYLTVLKCLLFNKAERSAHNLSASGLVNQLEEQTKVQSTFSKLTEANSETSSNDSGIHTIPSPIGANVECTVRSPDYVEKSKKKSKNVSFCPKTTAYQLFFILFTRSTWRCIVD